LQVPEWNQGEIAMGFIVGLPRTQFGYDFRLGNCVPTDKGSSLQACQDNLHRTATSRVVYATSTETVFSVG
jgi:hypothetical protein